MNLYAAAQREDGRWEFVCASRERGLHPVGFCAGWRQFPNALREYAESAGVAEMTLSLHHTDGHANAADARACYLEWLVTQARFGQAFDPRDTLTCAWGRCGKLTAVRCTVLHDWTFPLCDEHKTPDHVRDILRGVQIERLSSW